jgi:hypothetical protein
VQYSRILSIRRSSASAATLDAVFPQPVRSGSSANVMVTAGAEGTLRLALFDMLGREVGTLFEGTMSAGSSRIVLIPASALTPGIWFLRLSGADGVQLQKISVLR